MQDPPKAEQAQTNGGDTADSTPAACSVWDAFDKMQLCYTLIPQVKHYYRYGNFRDCTADREEFNFCLKMKMKSRPVAEKLIRERRDLKYQQKITERSSLDIWELRSSPPENFPPAPSTSSTSSTSSTPSSST
ncbi:uncharacterized protein BJ171DRAFT_501024 [Polychytrium aggregatum]|uniref:uncharacterized protein n=1 Tax=Polychytrium aggregatum TaxID=110093 RepID=UPI0022FDE295|nr:uncharacterized protein BJ171DRAFT_501024 [Polychytrium aggregatum]KAI9205634.1 hypothetical protein BJ171DRAFT_501024 [Polychytrium aggregatum]